MQGIIVSHVDDWLVSGNNEFEKDIVSKLKEKFQFSKVEKNNFKYCGCNISVEDGVIKIDQQDYINSLQKIEYTGDDLERELNDAEKKKARGKLGELLWISLLTRPDLSFEVNLLSSEINRGTVSTLKAMNKVVEKAQNSSCILQFKKLGDISDLRIKVYADASFCNQDDRTRSTSGRAIVLEQVGSNMVNLISWKTRKINRICRSVKAAETLALEEAVDEAVNTAPLIKEIYEGKIDLKQPSQIPVICATDSKSLWENVHNTRQCEEKLLRNSIASIKQLIEFKFVEDVLWVPTTEQLADCLTKKGQNSKWLLAVASMNNL